MRIADHFTMVWRVHFVMRDQVSGDGARTRRRRTILHRHHGLCAVPGCSRAALHVHHIVFRSRGGSDDLVNLLGLCPTHHDRAVHKGRLVVVGHGGALLEWRFPTAEGLRTEWVTIGDDDVRRVGAAAPVEATVEAEPCEAEPWETEPWGAQPREAEPWKAESWEAEPWEAEPWKAQPREVRPCGAESWEAEPCGAHP